MPIGMSDLTVGEKSAVGQRLMVDGWTKVDRGADLGQAKSLRKAKNVSLVKALPVAGYALTRKAALEDIDQEIGLPCRPFYFR
jgi:hypothetical protein